MDLIFNLTTRRFRHTTITRVLLVDTLREVSGDIIADNRV